MMMNAGLMVTGAIEEKKLRMHAYGLSGLFWYNQHDFKP